MSRCSFSVLYTNSGSRNDWRLFIAVMHPITVTVGIFHCRNVNVVDDKVLAPDPAEGVTCLMLYVPSSVSKMWEV